MLGRAPRLPADLLRLPVAHRALHDVADGRPENSRAAVSAAIAAGYAIEIDLQLSADGRAIVFHDYSLARLAEAEGPLRSRSAAELAAIGLRGGAEGIPDFRTILDLVAGRVPLLVEIKDQDGAMGPSIGALEAAAVFADLTEQREAFEEFADTLAAFLAALEGAGEVVRREWAFGLREGGAQTVVVEPEL